jgi:hypothetical protein
MMNELYKAGWNARIETPSMKLPRDSKKNEDFLRGFRDCNSKFMESISDSIRTGQSPVYPEKV